MQKYDVDYFIEMFEAIPEDQWTTGYYTDPENPEKHCVLGHCAARAGDQMGCQLQVLLEEKFPNVVYVNDRATFLGDTPKKRILKALRMIKNGE
jgi:hypothetical protein